MLKGLSLTPSFLLMIYTILDVFWIFLQFHVYQGQKMRPDLWLKFIKILYQVEKPYGKTQPTHSLIKPWKCNFIKVRIWPNFKSNKVFFCIRGFKQRKKFPPPVVVWVSKKFLCKPQIKAIKFKKNIHSLVQIISVLIFSHIHA